jgi:[methyl-Co(III) methanol-specific corrinoid protein]:coenzyme M methyltransferase
MFRFTTPQKVCRIGNAEFGGQPGARPPLLVANMFQRGDKLLHDRKTVAFDRAAATARIRELERLVAETGIPALVGLVAPTLPEMKAYTEFYLRTTNLPFGIDTWTQQGRLQAAQHVAELGVQDKFLYNSITAWDKDIPGQVAQLKDLGIQHVVIQAFDMEDKHATGRVKSLRALLAEVEKGGFASIIVDTSVMNLPATSISLIANRLIKEEFGLPVGLAPANASYMWKDALTKFGKDFFRGADAGLHAIAAILWSDWIIYGPMSGTARIFATVAAATTLLATLAAEEGARLPAAAQHPLNRLFPKEAQQLLEEERKTMPESTDGKTPRARVLSLFKGEKPDRPPVFSGMGNVTVHGIYPHGWRFAEIHTDAEKMARAAASTSQLFGFECAVAPFDMGVEAEALGCTINYYTQSSQDILYPTISKKLGTNVEELKVEIPPDLETRGRVPLVLDAIRKLKAEVGNTVAVGAWVLGPFTLTGQIVELDNLLKMSFKKTAVVSALLDQLTGLLIQLAKLYRAAGADYITVREMGATSDVLSPRMFKALILPPLQKIFAALEPPRVLHICGTTSSIFELMAEAGAEAISIDQKNDAADAVKRVGDKVLVFGNLDPYGVLVTGTPELIREKVKGVLDAGIDAVWPGCDIWPSVPQENMQALMSTVKEYGTPLDT